MSDVYKCFRHGRYVTKVASDDAPSNPRSAFSNIGIIVVSDRDEYLCDERNKCSDLDFCFDDFNSWGEAEEWIKKQPNVIAVKPISVIDHSRVVVYQGDSDGSWDCSRCGFHVVTRNTCSEILGSKLTDAALAGDTKALDKVYSCMEQDIELLQRYFDGDVWGYNIYKIPARFNEEAFTDDELADACKYFDNIDASYDWYDDPQAVFEEAVADLSCYVDPNAVVVWYNKDPLIFNSADDATEYFTEGAMACDPGSSESSRYYEIVAELKTGKKFVKG